MSGNDKGPKVVFAMYRPHAGKAEALAAMVRQHHPTLLRLGLATARKPIVVRTEDGTIIEVFEWVTGEAAERAHHHPQVAKIWEGMGTIADFGRLKELKEAALTFPHFTPIDATLPDRP